MIISVNGSRINTENILEITPISFISDDNEMSFTIKFFNDKDIRIIYTITQFRSNNPDIWDNIIKSMQSFKPKTDLREWNTSINKLIVESMTPQMEVLLDKVTEYWNNSPSKIPMLSI